MGKETHKRHVHDPGVTDPGGYRREVLSSLHLMCNRHPWWTALTHHHAGRCALLLITQSQATSLAAFPSLVLQAAKRWGDPEITETKDKLILLLLKTSSSRRNETERFLRKCLCEASTRCQQQLLFIRAEQCAWGCHPPPHTACPHQRRTNPVQWLPAALPLYLCTAWPVSVPCLTQQSRGLPTPSPDPKDQNNVLAYYTWPKELTSWNWMGKAALLHPLCRWDAGGREIKLNISEVPVVRGGHTMCLFQPSTPTTKPLFSSFLTSL